MLDTAVEWFTLSIHQERRRGQRQRVRHPNTLLAPKGSSAGTSLGFKLLEKSS
jgi:hypothetical protein